MAWLLLATLALAALGSWLLFRARTMWHQSGLPVGRVTYVDTGALDRCERPLFSSRYQLTGRPDYLVRNRKGLVPVEIKSGAAPDQPFSAHILQLAAYCLLVEEQEGRSPPYGILQYRDRAFEIEFTPGLRAQLLANLEALRGDLFARDVSRSHNDPARCRSCGYRAHCDQRLA
jgi:CRISPR-associated exonuclease Cas4